MIARHRAASGAVAIVLALALVACGDGIKRGATPAASVSSSPTIIVATPATIIATPATPAAESTPTALAATATSMAASATATALASGDTGIDGTVTLGPTCPVERADSPCPDRPYEARITIWRGETKVAETRSGADGRFRVSLPPGVYLVAGESENTLPRGSEETVTVVEGRLTEVRIRFDSGIR